VKTIVPVGNAQVGCVTLDVVGTAGGVAALITTLADAADVQFDALVTVKLYVPAASPEIVVLAVFPTIAPGLIVQFPAGKPLRTTLPVVKAHVGWVIVPTVGSEGREFTVTRYVVSLVAVQPFPSV
jgi:hypothetical protein